MISVFAGLGKVEVDGEVYQFIAAVDRGIFCRVYAVKRDVKPDGKQY